MTILQVPMKFTSLNMLKFHVEQHHGYWFGDIKTLREGVKAHAQMHDGSHTPVLHTPVAHIHANVTELSIIKFQ